MIDSVQFAVNDRSFVLQLTVGAHCLKSTSRTMTIRAAIDLSGVNVLGGVVQPAHFRL